MLRWRATGIGGNGRRERSCIVYLVLGLDVELDLLARQGADSGVPWLAGQAEGVGAFLGGGFVLDVHDFWWWGEGSRFKENFEGSLESSEERFENGRFESKSLYLVGCTAGC